MSLVARRKLRSPLKYPGGKQYLARRIIAEFPPHRTYTEAFCGGLSVLLNKVPAEYEVANDIDPDLIRFWEDVQDRPDAFASFVRSIPYVENSFETACFGGYADAFGPSAGYLIRNRMSRGGMGKTFAWSERLRGGKPGDVNAWETFREEFPLVVRRVDDVRFFNRDALEVIREHDNPDALHYVDPCYLVETRSASDVYRHEFTPKCPGVNRTERVKEDRARHRRLIATLNWCRGAVVLSGYPSPLYAELLDPKEWRLVTFDMANHAGQGKEKQRRTECLWIKGAK